MNGAVIYYLKNNTLSSAHRRHISEAMLRHYALQPMTVEHKRHIGEGQKKRWTLIKEYWREHGGYSPPSAFK